MSIEFHPEDERDRAVMQAMRDMLARMPALEFAPASRPAFEELMQQTPVADGISFETGTVGAVPGVWCRPKAGSARTVMLYLHGGAYVLGSAIGHRNFVSQIVLRAGAPAFIPDYRLAPEHAFPAAIDDAQSVFTGLGDLGHEAIALAGDSAGGGLALSLLALVAAKARQGTGVMPRCAALMSPWTDLALAGGSMLTRAAADPLVRRDELKKAADLYLKGADPIDPRASPLYQHLGGLPPLLIHVGDDEILLDDSRRVAEAASSAGGEAALHIWEGMTHVFPSNLAQLQAARQAVDMIGAFMRQHL
ncbi:alpha/beta hydrolase fold domain-containing protein [Mesorhizobium sp. BH1-1-4]|uniref:alpha/beta hydrolase fold domain-containing protein n=1 Tax=Mesorhizobium sp. BH1-1-4 TaxID=2876662 RepID=UPI001CD168DA|nr:alpha/beta hydrolase fold domain-containing protein [Mesorhizobium sp. BH1-1-4]MBZ9998337.1 alpha/beta hydrolase [Mesorhizobium sp. BH1-1-4]